MAYKFSKKDIHFPSEALTSPGYCYVYGIAVGDLTGNGSLDITVADGWASRHDDSGTRTSSRIIGLFNDGTGLFTEQVLADGIQGDENASLVERHVLADLNGNGYLDIVAVHIDQNKLVSIENPGDRTSPLVLSMTRLTKRSKVSALASS